MPIIFHPFGQLFLTLFTEHFFVVFLLFANRISLLDCEEPVFKIALPQRLKILLQVYLSTQIS